MTSQRKNWVISEIAKSAQSNIKNLDIKFYEKVIIRFEYLEKDPFLGDVRKVEGKKNIYRERIGNYRLYFKLVPHSRQIHILLFDYKGRIKNKTIQRLK